MADVPTSISHIRAFMRRAMQQAFPGAEEAHTDELLQLAAEHPVGSRVSIRVSAPTRRGDDFDADDVVLAPDARDRALAAQQGPWTQAFLDGTARAS